MTEVELRDHIGDLLDGWTASEVVGPNEETDDSWPAATGDVEDPATLLTWEFSDEEPEDGAMFATFGKTEMWRGELMITVWSEKDLGDRKMLQHIRDLQQTYLSASASTATEFSLGSSRVIGEAAAPAGFFGRTISWPYLRIDEP